MNTQDEISSLLPHADVAMYHTPMFEGIALPVYNLRFKLLLLLCRVSWEDAFGRNSGRRFWSIVPRTASLGAPSSPSFTSRTPVGKNSWQHLGSLFLNIVFMFKKRPVSISIFPLWTCSKVRSISEIIGTARPGCQSVRGVSPHISIFCSLASLYIDRL